MVEILRAQEYFADDTIRICVIRRPYMKEDIVNHAHEFHEIMIVESGMATHHYHGHEDTICMGDVFVIPPFHFHRYTMKDNCGVEVVNVMFDLRDLKMDLRDLGELPGFHALFSVKSSKHSQPHFRLNAADLAKVIAMVNIIEMEQEGLTPGNAFARENNLRRLMLFLSRRYSHVANPDGKKILEMGEVVSYMEQHLGETIVFTNLAEVVNMSPTAFRRTFQEAFACSPMAYLQQLRVKKAMLLLTDPTKSIGDVAFEVGFNDSGYFSRVFKQETGETPRAYRQQL